MLRNIIFLLLPSILGFISLVESSAASQYSISPCMVDFHGSSLGDYPLIESQLRIIENYSEEDVKNELEEAQKFYENNLNGMPSTFKNLPKVLDFKRAIEEGNCSSGQIVIEKLKNIYCTQYLLIMDEDFKMALRFKNLISSMGPGGIKPGSIVKVIENDDDSSRVCKLSDDSILLKDWRISANEKAKILYYSHKLRRLGLNRQELEKWAEELLPSEFLFWNLNKLRDIQTSISDIMDSAFRRPLNISKNHEPKFNPCFAKLTSGNLAMMTSEYDKYGDSPFIDLRAIENEFSQENFVLGLSKYLPKELKELEQYIDFMNLYEKALESLKQNQPILAGENLKYAWCANERLKDQPIYKKLDVYIKILQSPLDDYWAIRLAEAARSLRETKIKWEELEILTDAVLKENNHDDGINEYIMEIADDVYHNRD